ncbi:zinc finger protein 579, partial [Sarcophilus harrisii]|uniref:zinc finger protein 579 n=1 Tax=Sarcophilus harrisii TaxID=9305 RepID=UPI001301C3C8
PRLASYLRQHRRVHGALSLLAPAPSRADKEERGVAGASKGWNFAKGAESQGQNGEEGGGLQGEAGPGEDPPPPPPPPVEPRFRCPECGKGFRRRAHLRQHGVTHSGARPFQCVRCQREFKRLADLARHAQVHAGGPAPHPCPRCPRRFSRAYSLLRHQRCHRAEVEGALSRAAAPAEEAAPAPAETVDDPPSPPSPSRSPPPAPAYLSASCFDSQDHSAFELEEEEEGGPGGTERVPS